MKLAGWEISGNPSVFIVEPIRRGTKPTPGVRLRVELDQNVPTGPGWRLRPGPHYVGKAEVLDDGRLAIWLTEASAAGRTARGLLEIDALDVVLWGTRPTVRLRA